MDYMNSYAKGVACILTSAFCFAVMNVCVRMAGDLPSVQKSFLRNLIAAVFALILLLMVRQWLKIICR